jgi:hypothetical protein
MGKMLCLCFDSLPGFWYLQGNHNVTAFAILVDSMHVYRLCNKAHFSDCTNLHSGLLNNSVQPAGKFLNGELLCFGGVRLCMKTFLALVCVNCSFLTAIVPVHS